MRLTRVLAGACLLAASALLGIAWAAGVPGLRAGWRDDYRRPQGIPYPDGNPWSAPKAKLGATLFFDPVLSASHTMSCATCHQPGMAWGDGLPRSVGDRHEPMEFRSPTLLNTAWLDRLGWDGKFPDEESVSVRAITADANMALPAEEALDRLRSNPAYVRRFQVAFGPGGITQDRMEQALATYVRGIVSAPAPFDRWVDGDEGAVGDAAKRGFALFEGKAGCAACHSGWAFTDGSFADIGTATGTDIGRGALFPSSVALRYAFKVPTLRDAAARAPYMHDGSVPTLEAVVDLYDHGGIARPSRSPKIRPLGLTAAEKADLVSFLQTLTEDAQQIIRPLPPH